MSFKDGIRHISIQAKNENQDFNHEEKTSMWNAVYATKKQFNDDNILNDNADNTFQSCLEQSDLQILFNNVNINDPSSENIEKMQFKKSSSKVLTKRIRPQTSCSSIESSYCENIGSQPFNSEKSFDSQSRPRSNRSNQSISGRKIRFPDSRQSMSFSNSKVRDIDAENHRLLKEIIKRKSDSSRSTTNMPVRLQSASAVNRMRKQKEIERENLRLLGKIQSAKPTNGISRSELIKDHITNEILVERLSKTNKRNNLLQEQSVSRLSALQKHFDNESVISSASSFVNHLTHKEWDS
ncbi:uncharacterized protein LOC136091432 [Hydra vulgaris]|uniref:Uncharacterized protein LOC136091432 n=1 Tax=Hydra vulgaris TaxID=6087 RepID=A0ABM4DKN2_HYDVU